MKKNKIIAITGGIGSGKSFALSVLEKEGYPVLSSDKIVNELYKKNSVKRKLKRLFPTAVSGFINLTIDKKVIAKAVFNNKEKHQQLTKAITPLVLKQIKKRTKTIEGLIFVEVPLLFECGYQTEFDGVMVIVRDKKSRIDSVITRSNLTEQEVLARVSYQLDYDSLDLSEYIVITNDGDKQRFTNLILSTAKKIAYDIE